MKKLKTFCISLLILILIVFIGINVWAIATIYDESLIQEAYTTLYKATKFSYEPVGYAGSMTKEIEAFSKIRNSRYAKKVFEELEREATAAGKLYALCGLYYLDYDYYYMVIDEYSKSDIQVETFSGCTKGNESIKDLIKSDYDPTVQLSSNRDTIFKWCKRNKIDCFGLDFYGGGIPCTLNDYIKENSRVFPWQDE